MREGGGGRRWRKEVEEGGEGKRWRKEVEEGGEGKRWMKEVRERGGENEEITSDIQKYKQNIWKEHLDAHWDHRHNTHTLWKTIHGLSNRAPPHTLNTSITFNNKIATAPTHIANWFTKQFTNTVKHATHKTNRHINRATLHSLLLRSKRL